MRLKNIPGAREAIEANKYVVQEEDAEVWSIRDSWHEIFGNDNPVRVEIGMGKGTFLMECARRSPDINFVGIEKYSSVLFRALQKQDEENLPNIRFLRMDAEDITAVFPAHFIDRIYLNFSDPWPKARTAKRRLTSRQFLARYDKVLKEEGVIEFKTDNRPLFDFSLEEVPEAGWKLLACTFDLHKDPVMNEGNIMTEYERKFSELGNKICKMVIAR